MQKVMKNIQETLKAAVESVIGTHEHKVHQYLTVDDSMGKVVTVRYEGVTETNAAQIEAVRVLMALKSAGFAHYKIRLFVTDDAGKNMGSIEVKPPWWGVIEFETVGNKWRGKAVEAPEQRTKEYEPLTIIDDPAPMPSQFVTRMAGVFRKFYGEKRIDDATYLTTQGEGESDMPTLPHEPGHLVDEDFHRKRGKLTDEHLLGKFIPPEEDEDVD